MPSIKTYELLEFNKIKEKVTTFSILQMTKREILNSLPSFNVEKIKKSLALTKEADLLLNKYLIDPLLPFDDVEAVVSKARVDSTLNMGELLRVARLLRSGRVLKMAIQSTPDDIVRLREITSSILIDRQLENSIFESIGSECEMSDRASEKLYGLRRKLASLNVKLKEKLASYTRNNNSSKYLQDNLVMIREGRYVLPVKAENRSFIPGIVHDKSSTGATVFIEPFPIVELNNELREVVTEEQTEVERILQDFTKKVANGSTAIENVQKSCIAFDIILCKAKYSTSINGVYPAINHNKQIISLLNARHPLIDANKVVPINVSIGDGYNILLITGPNTGGKTVSLKTVGLFCLMAYFGLFLPCDEANLCIFDDIFCDIGDDQSIENELSTFSSHVSALIKIVKNMTNKSLILLDEVGGGTDPEEGAALAIGILDYISKVGSTAILTTHYGQVKEFALKNNRIMNASMQFNEYTFTPTFVLSIGMPGSSNALKIAKRLGLPQAIIDTAESSLSKEKVAFEKIIENAEKIQRESQNKLLETQKIKDDLLLEKIEIEKKRKQVEQLYDKIHKNAVAETKRLVTNSVERANEIIETMAQLLKETDEKSILEARKLRRELENLDADLKSETLSIECEDILQSEIMVGIDVVVKNIGSIGKVKSINFKRKQAEIQIGALLVNVAFEDLGKPLQQKSPIKKDRVIVVGEKAKSGFTQKEIFVIGMTVSEAVEKIEPYVISMFSEDDAKELRIVHGKGTGALGRGIQSFLKASPMVEEYRYGRYGEGDGGVTIAKIK